MLLNYKNLSKIIKEYKKYRCKFLKELLFIENL